MMTMTCSDDSAVAFLLRAVPLDAPAAGDDTDAEDGWTPAVARIIAAIARTLESFPEALAAVQATIGRLQAAPS